MNKRAMTTTIMIVVVLTLVFLILIATGVLPKMVSYFNKNILGKAPNEEIKLPGGGTSGAATFRDLKLSADKTTALQQLVSETFSCWSDFATFGQDNTVCSRIIVDKNMQGTITETEFQQALASSTEKASDGTTGEDLAGTSPEQSTNTGNAWYNFWNGVYNIIWNPISSAFAPNNYWWRIETLSQSTGTFYSCGQDDKGTNVVAFTKNVEEDCK